MVHSLFAETISALKFFLLSPYSNILGVGMSIKEEIETLPSNIDSNFSLAAFQLSDHEEVTSHLGASVSPSAI